MAADAAPPRARFSAGAHTSFRFLGRDLSPQGHVTLEYALDDAVHFREQLDLPLSAPLGADEHERAGGLLALLHWAAGVSYYKTSLPPTVEFAGTAPGPAAAALLEAAYSEGLGELAFSNGLDALPRPRFGASAGRTSGQGDGAGKASRVLVPVGGGKDSAVAIEIVRRAGVEQALFSIGDAAPIARTVAVAELPHLCARRRLDPALAALNDTGAINGHVPVTLIVSCVALLTAALGGFDAVAMANERSASAGNIRFDGVEVNHQWSKSLAAERLLRAAVAEVEGAPAIFSLLRPASELAIARAFARLQRYDGAFTSCNAIFRLDPALRARSWCCECPKCRFVFLALAPFAGPQRLREIFGRDLLAEEAQFEGFALLTATGGHKPFECVGEEQESLAAIRLLAGQERWGEHPVLRRLVAEVLPRFGAEEGRPAEVLALSPEHELPAGMWEHVHALLGS